MEFFIYIKGGQLMFFLFLTKVAKVCLIDRGSLSPIPNCLNKFQPITQSFMFNKLFGGGGGVDFEVFALQGSHPHECLCTWAVTF